MNWELIKVWVASTMIIWFPIILMIADRLTNRDER